MISTGYTINTRVKRKFYGIAGALITLAIPLILLLNHADQHLETDQSLCPFKLLTGFPCPGCGITKSLVFLYAGDIHKSLHYHLLGPIVVFACLFTIVLLLAELYTGKEYFTKWMYNKKFAYLLGAVLAAYHITRLVWFVHDNSWEAILQQSIWR